MNGFRQYLVLLVGAILAVQIPKIVVPVALAIAFVRYFFFSDKKTTDLKGTPDKLAVATVRRPPILSPRLGPLGLMHFAVTYRAVLFLLFGAIPLMLINTHSSAMAWLVLYNICLAVLFWFDYRLAVKPELLRCRRVLPGKFSVGVPNTVSIIIENFSFRRVCLDLRDEYPSEFISLADTPILNVTMQRRSMATISYQVQPESRGLFQFGRLNLRYLGPMSLVMRQREVPIDETVEVYPNIKSIARLDLRLRRSHLLETGLISERKRGSGSDFESLRDYVFGDEFRKIDWKATARRNQLISREYQVEVNQSILLVIDRSRPMGQKAGVLTMLDHAVNAALLLGYQVTRQGDKIGLITYSNRIDAFISPGKGKNHYSSFLRALAEVKPASVESDATTTCRFLLGRRLRRSLLIVITDQQSSVPLRRLGQQLAPALKKHLVVVISLINPAFLEKMRQLPNNAAQLAEKVLARDIIERNKETLRSLEKNGIIALALGPEELTSSVLNTYLKVKLRDRL